MSLIWWSILAVGWVLFSWDGLQYLIALLVLREELQRWGFQAQTLSAGLPILCWIWSLRGDCCKASLMACWQASRPALDLRQFRLTVEQSSAFKFAETLMIFIWPQEWSWSSSHCASIVTACEQLVMREQLLKWSCTTYYLISKLLDEIVIHEINLSQLQASRKQTFISLQVQLIMP